jgi:predicted nucleic acid-binding protein
MIATTFVDTNVLISALDDADLKKQQAARRWREELWRNRSGRISFQILQEFYAKITRKWPDARPQARVEVHDLMAWQPLVIDGEQIELAWKIQDRLKFSFWDALVVAAAKSLNCRYLLTEDLQADQELEGVLVVNPFSCDPQQLSG